MPCYKLINNCPEKDIKLKFAWLPLNDMDGESIWLQRYWEYGDWCDIGFFVLRGRQKKYTDKESFWNSVRYRIAGMF